MGVEEILNIEEEHKREFRELLQYCLASGRIDQNLYQEYDVKRGLRDSSGKGVLTGLTEISDVVGYTYEDGRKIPADGQVVKSIVTTNLVDAVAKNYGAELIEVLTGFKWIGKQVLKNEQEGKGTYLFGMEESYGCLAGTYARDKDACVAVMMLCEVASWCKKHGKTLWDAMIDLYEKYGYYREGLSTMTLKGIDGAAQIQQMMSDMRNNPKKTLGGFEVLAVRDYKEDTRKDLKTGEVTKTGLPASNVLYYELSDNAWCCVRPSGTEPKIKFYYGVKGTSLQDAEEKLEALKKDLVEE